MDDIYHKDFVKNPGGRYIVSILATLGSIPLLLVLQGLYYRRVAPEMLKEPGKLADLVFIVFPTLFLLTNLSHVVIELAVFMLLCAAVGALFMTGKHRGHYARTTKRNYDIQFKPHLGWFKGLGSLVTCVSILAVDFSAFPRRSAKTCEFGISLMDIGGAFFVVSSGLTSRWARGLAPHMSLLSKQTVIIVGLGVARLAAVKFFDYQEVAEEYGVHWNFFFTLASVWVLSDIAHAFASCFVVKVWGDIVEILVLITLACLPMKVHQELLNEGWLTEFIFNANREGGFFKQNREGVLSLPMYCLMFVTAEMMARGCLWTPAKNCSRRLLLGTVILWAAWFYFDNFQQETSRRLANISFATLGLALCFSVLSLLLMVERLLNKWGAATCFGRGLAAHASLETFLFANVLTGLVNSLVDTKHTTDSHALVILAVYCSAVYALSVLKGSNMRNAIIDEQL